MSEHIQTGAAPCSSFEFGEPRTSDHPSPIWEPLADILLERLKRHHEQRAREALEALEEVDEDQVLSALSGTRRADTLKNRDGLRLPAKEVLLTLRLAAAFGSEEQYNAAFEPGAITGIGGINSKETTDLGGLLNKALLPPGWSGAGMDASGDNTLIVLAPNINVTPLGLGSITSFWIAVAASLNSYAPAIYLFCADEPLPENLKAALPPPLSLPPADRDVAMRVLLERFAGTTPETARRLRDEIDNTLPAGDKLKPLSTELICYAARSATVETAVARLCRSVVAGPTPAKLQLQTLEGLTVSHPASSVLLRAVDDLEAWQNGMVTWSEMTRSFLLHGEPGVGKSWIAQAFGNSADVPFIQGSFAEWQSAGHLGEMLAAMRDTFKRAAKSKPAILFIDEIDSAGSRFEASTMNRSYNRQVINAFLQEIDELIRAEGVILIGACNQPAFLDPAILRPGRFDMHLEIPLPDIRAIAEILRTALPDDPENVLNVAQKLVGLTPAEIDGRIRAGRSLARGSNHAFDAAHLLAAIEREEAGVFASLHRMAVHEAGHAVVAHLLGLGPVTKVKVSVKGGETLRGLRKTVTLRAEILNEITVLLAGRAAEALVFEEVSSGAGGHPGSDLAMATRAALALERQFGFGSEGLVWQSIPREALSLTQKERSLVRRHLDAAENAALELLRPQLPILCDLAAALEEARELSGQDLDVWLQRLTPAKTATEEH